MAAAYRYVLDCDVAEDLLALPARHRDHFIRIFQELAGNPHQKGRSYFRDSSGREIQKGHFGHWLVSYWTDHAVKEVRIVGIQRAAR
jgi:hypothetical protein